MDRHVKPLIITEPLKFGDLRQINLIKQHEREIEEQKAWLPLCFECAEEGEETCDCEGMGVKGK